MGGYGDRSRTERQAVREKKTNLVPDRKKKMNQLTVLKDKAVTMTSREMADLTEKRHDNVRRTIESLFHEGLISKPQIEDGNKSANGVVERVYHVCKRDSYVIVAQLSPAFTARLVDRWQELEAVVSAPQFQIPTTLAGALRLAAEQAETIEAQALALTAAAPAIEFVAKYADSTGLKGFRQVCKLLGAKETEFREFLLNKKIMYRLGGEWVPHAAHMDTGRFVVKAGTSDVSGHAFNSAKFTPKGVQWVAGEFAKHNLGAV